MVEDLDFSVENFRSVLQILLKEHIKTASDRKNLANRIGCSESQVQAMLYDAKGGLDTWVKAFSVLYELNKRTLRNLKFEIKNKKVISEADQIWIDLKEDPNIDEETRLFLAKCAYESCMIKQDLETL